MKDWHAILGVAINCTLDEIKSAYRKKALEYHPDRNSDPAAKDRFVEIDTAYRILSNPNYKFAAKPSPTVRPTKKKDIWDVEETTFKDSMAGQYGYESQRPKTTFKDSMNGQYEHQRPNKPVIRPRPAPKPEPEVKLYWGGKNPMEGYWREYNRLKGVCAYEDPEVFWQKLDEWVQNHHQ